MEDLDIFEKAVLEKLVAGDHPVLAALRTQARAARLSSREYTGAGFFLTFDTPLEMPVLPAPDFEFGDVHATVDGLEFGAGFVVFVRAGRLSVLEGYSHQEDWPKKIHGFQLTYQSEPRGLELPELWGSLPSSDPRAT